MLIQEWVLACNIKYSQSNLMIFVDYEFNGILIENNNPQKSGSQSFFSFLRIFKGKRNRILPPENQFHNFCVGSGLNLFDRNRQRFWKFNGPFRVTRVLIPRNESI